MVIKPSVTKGSRHCQKLIGSLGLHFSLCGIGNSCLLEMDCLSSISLILMTSFDFLFSSYYRGIPLPPPPSLLYSARRCQRRRRYNTCLTSSSLDVHGVLVALDSVFVINPFASVASHFFLLLPPHSVPFQSSCCPFPPSSFLPFPSPVGPFRWCVYTRVVQLA